MVRIVRPTTVEWSIIKGFLETASAGAIVLPPEAQEHLRSLGISSDQTEIDYDFEGAPHIALDIVDINRLPPTRAKAQDMVDEALKGPETAVLMAGGIRPSPDDSPE